MGLYRKKDYLYQWEVKWKRASRFPIDVFDRLKDFCLVYPVYSEQLLIEQMSSKRHYYFENDELILARVPFQYKGIVDTKPNLRDSFFWEYDTTVMDWTWTYKCVIERVLSRGVVSDFEELVRFYGKETVLNTFRNQCNSFWDDMEEDARIYFGLEKEDLLIYHIRKSHNFWSPWNRMTV